MSEWRKIWANGLPNEGQSPKLAHRMAAEGMQFPWRWNGGTISLNLGVIWEMSAQCRPQNARPAPRRSTEDPSLTPKSSVNLLTQNVVQEATNCPTFCDSLRLGHGLINEVSL